MSDIVLYLLMRDDIPSMNPGKLAAQASHVSNACVNRIKKSKNRKLKSMLKEWELQTDNGFGTAICLATNENDLFPVLTATDNYIYDIVYDPSYPCEIPTEVAGTIYGRTFLSKDGYSVIVKPNKPNSIFLRPELVGAYLFGDFICVL